MAVNANVTVPAELVAAGLPADAASVGTGANVDVGNSQGFTMEATEFYPFAFQFILLSWNKNKWEIKDNPQKRPQAKGAVAPEPPEWAFDEAPAVAES